MTINAQIWGGSGSVRIIDMTNAGKRGKTCRVFAVDGGATYTQNHDTAEWQAYWDFCRVLTDLHGSDFASRGGVNLDVDFDTILAKAKELNASIHEREAIRGIDAPKPELIAGIDGVWSASADEGGISMSDLTDQNNCPRQITFGQTNAAAYKLASKVWHKLADCKTMHEAGRVLSDAGCRLHYYCAMD